MHCVRTEHRVFNVWLAGSCLYVKAYHFHLSSAFFSVDFSYFTRKREIQSVTGKWKDEKNKIYILIFSPTLQTKDYDQCFPRSWPAFAVPPPRPPACLPLWLRHELCEKLYSQLFYLFIFLNLSDFHPTAELLFALCCKVNMMENESL